MGVIEIRRDPIRVAAHGEAQLLAAKDAAGMEVNTLVGQIRQRYITVTPGQEMIYLAKEAEAARLVADPGPDPAEYPMLSAEVGITAPTIWEVAQVILNLGAQWRGIGARLEAFRLGRTGAIWAAGAIGTVETLLDAARSTTVEEILND